MNGPSLSESLKVEVKEREKEEKENEHGETIKGPSLWGT